MVIMSEEITQIIIGFPNGIEECKNIKYFDCVVPTYNIHHNFLQLTFNRVNKEK